MNDRQEGDDARLLGLQKELGPDVLAQLIDIFLEDTPHKIESAIIAEQAHDFQNVRQAVHPLKSNAGELGFVKMQQLAREIESLAGSEEMNGMAELLQALQQSFLEAKRRLLEYKETLVNGKDTACGRQ